MKRCACNTGHETLHTQECTSNSVHDRWLGRVPYAVGGAKLVPPSVPVVTSVVLSMIVGIVSIDVSVNHVFHAVTAGVGFRYDSVLAILPSSTRCHSTPVTAVWKQIQRTCRLTLHSCKAHQSHSMKVPGRLQCLPCEAAQRIASYQAIPFLFPPPPCLSCCSEAEPLLPLQPLRQWPLLHHQHPHGRLRLHLPERVHRLSGQFGPADLRTG